jgi:cytochrome d ubiquinol oxidase subunit I
MQHPVAFAIAPDGSLQIADLGGYLMNSWAWSMLAHNQAAALVSGAFVVAGTGAYYQLRGVHNWQAHLYLRWGVTLGLIASVIVAFPTGDHQAKLVARNQEVALAAMEGRFNSGPMAPITLIGQPNVVERRLDNPIALPGVLSFLAYGTFHADVRGLAAFPEDTWPTSIEPLYYAFHIMAGLGTLFIALMGLATLDSWRGRLEGRRALLWTLMLALPFPFIANAAGWMTAEMGRQPWLVYGLYRTRDGASDVVSAGNTIFTLIGFCGLYLVLGLLYLYLVGRDVARGPAHDVGASGDLAVIE